MARAITIETWNERLKDTDFEVLELIRFSSGRLGGLCKCKKCGGTEEIKELVKLPKNGWHCLHCPERQSECDGCGNKFSVLRTAGLDGNKRMFCYECIPFGQATLVTLKYKAHWKRVKREVGDACVCCGFSEDYGLQFHHRDPAQKEETVAYMLGVKPWKEIKIELDKCAIVCANCHAGIHAGKVSLPE
jgi:hypothetical protein